MRYMSVLILSALAAAVSGCLSAPEIYEPTERYYVERQRDVPPAVPQIEVGRPNLLLDGLNHYLLSLPTKIILLNGRALDHRLEQKDRDILERYLAINQMVTVKIRHNQYAPLADLKRLIGNGEVGPFYRATFGLFSWLQYTLLPDRLFAGTPLGVGDHFNPYTNTIHVYSSDVTILLHEAGHAKDYLQREAKGTSSLLRVLPGIDLVEEGYASSDAVRFLQCIGDRENELRAYRTLIPAYSTYVSGYVGGGPLVALPVVLAGHIVGRRQAAARARGMDLEAEGVGPDGRFQRSLFQPEICSSVTAGADEAPAESVISPSNSEEEHP